MFRLLLGALLGLAMMGVAGPARAILISYTFDMLAFTSGPEIGNTSTLDVVVDNGNSTPISQSYLNTDISEFTITVGGVSYISTALLYSGTPAVWITTDAFGVPVLDLSGTADTCAFLPANNQLCKGDNFGNYVLFDGSQFSQIKLITAPITGSQTIPEPASLTLFGVGLILIGLVVIVRRRRDRDQISGQMAV